MLCSIVTSLITIFSIYFFSSMQFGIVTQSVYQCICIYIRILYSRKMWDLLYIPAIEVFILALAAHN